MRVLFDQGTPETSRNVAIIVLMSTSWPRIRAVAPVIYEAVKSAVAGSYVEIVVP